MARGLDQSGVTAQACNDQFIAGGLRPADHRGARRRVYYHDNKTCPLGVGSLRRVNYMRLCANLAGQRKYVVRIEAHTNLKGNVFTDRPCRDGHGRRYGDICVAGGEFHHRCRSGGKRQSDLKISCGSDDGRRDKSETERGARLCRHNVVGRGVSVEFDEVGPKVAVDVGDECRGEQVAQTKNHVRRRKRAVAVSGQDRQ